MKRKLLLCFIMLFAFAIGKSWAQSTVTGTVTDPEDGLPLPGVNVLIKGTGTGTITDVNGVYSLSVASDAILIFSFIGYASQEVVVGSRSVIDLQMTSDTKQLSEVVVTAAGIEANKRELGYSIQNVDGR